MIQRKRFRNCNIQTSTLEKEAKLPASYQGPNRQNCLLLNDDKLTEPLYSRSSDYVRLNFFQLKFDEIKWCTLSTYECCLSGPGWIFLFFRRFWAENILTAVCGFVHFFCAIFTVQILSACHVPFIKLSLASNIWLWQAQNFFNFFFLRLPFGERNNSHTVKL